MLKLMMKDLIIRLDENRKVLQLLVPRDLGTTEELRVFHEISEDEIPATESLETYIGSAVLAFLSATYAEKSFLLEQYRMAGGEFGRAMDEDANVLLSSGDADDEFEGAILRIDRFDETWSLNDVDGITDLLKQSAKRGSKEAAQYLRKSWPTRMRIMKKRLSRNSKDSQAG